VSHLNTTDVLEKGPPIELNHHYTLESDVFQVSFISEEQQDILGKTVNVHNEFDPTMVVIFSLAQGKIFQFEVMMASKKIEKNQ